MKSGPRKSTKMRRYLFGALIVAVGTVLFGLLNIGTDPIGQAVERQSLSVEVLKLTPRSERAVVRGFGIVEPARVLEVRPQVSGHVVWINPQLVEGGRIAKGDALFRLDPRDYEIAVEAKKAEVAKADSDLRLELGNQVIAQHEWELFKRDEGSDETQIELALHLPQLKEKQAMLHSAQSELRRAELELERTTLRASFAAIVLEKNVEIGAYLDSSSLCAKLAAVDEFFVKARIPEEAVGSIEFNPQTGAPVPSNEVRIVHHTQAGREYRREGKLQLLIGSVDNEGRMAQLLVSVSDPLNTTDGKPPLLVGTYVQVEILGRLLENLVRIPRRAVREQNKIYVADTKDLFRIRSPNVAFSTDDALLVQGGLQPGDRVILSNIQTPLEGLRLKTQEVQDGKE